MRQLKLHNYIYINNIRRAYVYEKVCGNVFANNQH